MTAEEQALQLTQAEVFFLVRRDFLAWRLPSPGWLESNADEAEALGFQTLVARGLIEPTEDGVRFAEPLSAIVERLTHCRIAWQIAVAPRGADGGVSGAVTFGLPDDGGAAPSLVLTPVLTYIAGLGPLDAMWEIGRGTAETALTAESGQAVFTRLDLPSAARVSVVVGSGSVRIGEGAAVAVGDWDQLVQTAQRELPDFGQQ
ncbi:MAG: hypothetical protein LBJ02_05315 [Bifidobacteriaceae bacterium]|jgi:hypothetical protein|nr:hypothetical protein [Bifidobacteriaceae bacterium]